jgi:TetR/AcrR family transcriptional regulator, tetracycline repressor protein
MATPAVEVLAPRRGRPPKVSPEAILDVVDAKQSSDWTMASIAAELGVSEPAIYYHFPSKQALLVALGARVVGQLPVPAATENWEEWLGAFAEAALDYCRAHPFLADVELSAVAMQQTASVRLLDELLQRLHGYGFEKDSALMALAAVMVVVQQFTRTEVLASVQHDRLTALARESGATLAEDAYRDGRYLDVDETFRRMLRVVLAGIRTELAPRGRGRKSKR